MSEAPPVERERILLGAGIEQIPEMVAFRIDALVDLASEILTHRIDFRASFGDSGRADALEDLLRVGTSAGGARAKAVIAWNEDTHEVRSGQVDASEGFGCRLLEENGRRHFMTKRFDRLPGGGKLHMQSLGALAHYDFNTVGGVGAWLGVSLPDEDGRSPSRSRHR